MLIEVFDYMGWIVSIVDRDSISFLLLITFVSVRGDDVIHSRFDLGKKMFIDKIPFDVSKEQRELIMKKIEEIRS